MSCADKEGCFTITWEIENFDIFMRAEDGQLSSPAWKTDTTQGSAVWWHVFVYHCGTFINFQLTCLNKAWNPDRCELSAISSCCKILPTHPEFRVFQSANFCIRKNDMFDNKMQSNISLYCLTVECKMWRNSMKSGGFRIHSVLKNIVFGWCLEDSLFFNTGSSPNSLNKNIEKDDIRINMVLDSEGLNDQYNICVLALPIIDGCGCFSFVYCDFVCDCILLKTTSGSAKYDDLRTEYREKCKIVKQSGVTRNASCKLNLQLDTIVAHHNTCQYQISHPTSSQIVKTGGISEPDYDLLSNDLLQLYWDGALSDVTINTEGKSFSAHKSILAARSPVFRAMLEKLEDGSEVLAIDDVGSETMERMLVYLYGGFLENLQLEEAIALYYAADEYAIPSLKRRCADMKKACLSSDNVCDALILADEHSDEQLMKNVADFICDHQEVVSSPKWEELEESKPRLVVKITKLFLKRVNKLE